MMLLIKTILNTKCSNLKERQLRQRIRDLYKSGEYPTLITFNNHYLIHDSILVLLQSTRKNTIEKRMQTFVTINLVEGTYDRAYYHLIAKDLKILNPSAVIKYTIESKSSIHHHIHMITTLSVEKATYGLILLDEARGGVIMNDKAHTQIAPLFDYKLCSEYISKWQEIITLK